MTSVGADNEAMWKARFRVPVIRSAHVAAGAPERGLVSSNVSGSAQLHAWDVPSGRLRRLTDRPTGIMAGLLSPDGCYIYYHDDAGGNELGHFVRVPFEGGAAVDITPDLPPYPTFGLRASGEGKRLGFITADGSDYHLHVIFVGGDGTLSASKRIHSSALFLSGLVFSHDGAIAVMSAGADARSLQFGLIALETASGRIFNDITDDDGRLEAVAFAPIPGDPRLLARSNRTGIARPLILDVVQGTRTEIDLGELEGEVHPADWSVDGRQILLVHFACAVQRLFIYDVATKTLTPLNHRGGTYSQPHFAPDGSILAMWEDSTHPPHVAVLDAATGKQTPTPLAAPVIPPSRPWQSISFASTDQTQIQGWLAVPEGPGPFPTILNIHGGPESAVTEMFMPSSQSWLDHGFAFLSINYRGSTTFGRAFLEQIWGNLGRWEVEDMVAAREWLVTKGIADPARVLVQGWSYGGYLTLLALGKRPELWAGGMAGIAVADWAIAHEDTTDTLRGWRAARFGGTPEEVPERYAASSPITFAEQVRAPMMIIQGRNDTRTPPRSVEVYEAKMKAMGKAIEVHWFNAGHDGPFVVVDQAIEHHELMLRFAQRVVGASESRMNA